MPLKIKYILISLFSITIIAFLSSCNPKIDKFHNKRMIKSSETPLIIIKDKPHLICKIGRGQIFSSGKWRGLKDSDFSVKHEGRVNVHIFDKKHKNKRALQVIFDNRGQKIILCPVILNNLNKRVSCRSFYFLENDLKDGMKRTLNIRKFIRKSEITCAYSKTKLRSLIPPS